MGAQVLLRLVGFPGIDRLRDQLVMPHDILCLAGRGQMHPAQPVDMPAAAAHQRPDVLLVGSCIELAVELVVGGHEFFEVADLGILLLAGNRRVKFGDERFVVMDREPTHDFEFDRLPQEMRLLRQPHVDPADHGGILREDVDEAFLFEPHQRIADRRRADAELSGECGARQRRPRRQFQRDDHAAEALEYLRRGLAIAIEPVGRTRGCAAGYDLRGSHRATGRSKGLASDTLIH